MIDNHTASSSPDERTHTLILSHTYARARTHTRALPGLGALDLSQ